jgi:coproporphyrinogen III oxidase
MHFSMLHVACRAKVRFEKIIRDAQDSICAAVEEIDGNKFREDAWTREDGGGGISRVLQGGNVWEKAGVNVSVVYGSMPASAYRAATERNIEAPPDATRVPFFAAGISSVMHPCNPHAATMHFNYRYGTSCVQTAEWRGRGLSCSR